MHEHSDIFSTLDESSEVTSYLNHAALAEVREQDSIDFLRRQNPSRVLQIAKHVASRVLGISQNHEVYFARNTTEAYAIASGFLASRISSAKISLPNSKYQSIDRATSTRFNYGRRYSDTTYSTLEADYELPFQNTGWEVLYYDQTLKGIEDHILEERPDIVVFNRTDRINGREQNAQDYIRLINGVAKSISSDYEPFVISDSAQTLTNTDCFHIEGVAFQVGCFHKGLGAYHPLGFGVIHEDNYSDLIDYLDNNPNSYYPSSNSFEETEISSYGKGEIQMESFFCFFETLKYLSDKGLMTGMSFKTLEELLQCEEVSFTPLIEYRKHLYEKAYLRLRKIREIEITSDFPTLSKGYILSFKLDQNYPYTCSGFTKKLKESGIYVTHISETNEVRVSFGPSNTEKDVDHLIESIQQYI